MLYQITLAIILRGAKNDSQGDLIEHYASLCRTSTVVSDAHLRYDGAESKERRNGLCVREFSSWQREFAACPFWCSRSACPRFHMSMRMGARRTWHMPQARQRGWVLLMLRNGS